MSERVLCVDDETSVLDGYRRSLRKTYQIETAEGGENALKMVKESGPYAVVVSDMRMPGMDGVQLLREVKRIAPHTVRIMLTGNADQQTAIDAVNEGAIFRFLNKPCSNELLSTTLAAGIEQYRLITAEKELLEKTLRGSIKVLADVLSLANPTAFGRASRVRRIVRKLCDQLSLSPPWQYEIAAMLSQIGCITLPTNTLNKVYYNRELSSEESRMLDAHPGIGSDLVANIPRLAAVAKIIAYQQKCYDGSGPPGDDVAEDRIPIGARVLKVALDYDTLRWSGETEVHVLVTMHAREGCYDPAVLAALEEIVGFEASLEPRDVAIRDLTAQMIFAEDVLTAGGTLLVSKGQEVTTSLRQRLKNFARNTKIQEPIHVLVQGKPASHPVGMHPPQTEKEESFK